VYGRGSWVAAVRLDCVPSLDDRDREDGEQERESQPTWGLGTPETADRAAAEQRAGRE
jgi:hypothetical protein